MGEVEEVQEQMKADREALKEQMIVEVNPMPPSGLNQMNHPTSNMVGKDLGSRDDPHDVEIQNKHASRHMACLPTVHHPMWRILLV